MCPVGFFCNGVLRRPCTASAGFYCPAGASSPDGVPCLAGYQVRQLLIPGLLKLALAPLALPFFEEELCGYCSSDRMLRRGVFLCQGVARKPSGGLAERAPSRSFACELVRGLCVCSNLH
jgi:hypothetical protein